MENLCWYFKSLPGKYSVSATKLPNNEIHISKVNEKFIFKIFRQTYGQNPLYLTTQHFLWLRNFVELLLLLFIRTNQKKIIIVEEKKWKIDKIYRILLLLSSYPCSLILTLFSSIDFPSTSLGKFLAVFSI
jgi:hypothetical protein